MTGKLSGEVALTAAWIVALAARMNRRRTDLAQVAAVDLREHEKPRVNA